MNYEDALKFATEKHNGQVRKNSKIPYIVHPIAVSMNFHSEGLRILSVLHDVIEDTDATFDELRDIGLNETYIGIIDVLTHKKQTTYLDYILSIKKHSMPATVVKIADIKHNMFDLEEGCLKDKYRMALYILTS
jgi:(p)ppGpp synthase/HD superfamily hydrolase